MLKKITLVLVFLGVNTGLYAGGNDYDTSESSTPFIGLELGGTFVQGDTNGTKSGEPNHKGSGASFGLRFGAQNAQWRSMVIFDYFHSKKDDQKYERALIQVDYFVMPDTFAGTSFKPYVGINGGYVSYESTNIPNANGFTYGGQLGVVMALSNHIDVDLAYRYNMAQPTALDNIGSVVLGVNYIY